MEQRVWWSSLTILCLQSVGCEADSGGMDEVFPVYPVLEFSLSEANAFEYPDLRVIIKPIARSAYRSSLESSLRYTDYEGTSVANFGTLS